jgi:hypothetical protein
MNKLYNQPFFPLPSLLVTNQSYNCKHGGHCMGCLFLVLCNLFEHCTSVCCSISILSPTTRSNCPAGEWVVEKHQHQRYLKSLRVAWYYIQCCWKCHIDCHPLWWFVFGKIVKTQPLFLSKFSPLWSLWNWTSGKYSSGDRYSIQTHPPWSVQ